MLLTQEPRNSSYHFKFIMKSYLITLLMLTVSVLQWFIFIAFSKNLTSENQYHALLCLCVFSLILFLIMLITLLEELHVADSINMAIYISMVEFIIIGLSPIILTSCQPMVSFSLPFIILSTFVSILLGCFLPVKNYVFQSTIIFLLSFVSIVSGMHALAQYMAPSISMASYMYFTVMSAIISLFTVYHTQVVRGNYFIDFNMKECQIAALLLYINCVVLYIIAVLGGTVVWKANGDCQILDIGLGLWNWHDASNNSTMTMENLLIKENATDMTLVSI